MQVKAIPFPQELPPPDFAPCRPTFYLFHRHCARPTSSSYPCEEKFLLVHHLTLPVFRFSSLMSGEDACIPIGVSFLLFATDSFRSCFVSFVPLIWPPSWAHSRQCAFLAPPPLRQKGFLLLLLFEFRPPVRYPGVLRPPICFHSPTTRSPHDSSLSPFLQDSIRHSNIPPIPSCIWGPLSFRICLLLGLLSR